MKLTIKGKKPYIKRMYKHLRKEHPSTKKRMVLSPEERKIIGKKIKKKLAEGDFKLFGQWG